ncbi:MAG: MotA/TolQ/ExbB proton channel family protein [Bdellovibrionales bacterium]|nr:MotA/TolQ/ExbB proton channel family protein [Bdellovibrionales bacterium]
MLLAVIENLRSFIYAGGTVLVVILMTTLLLWTLIIERLLYFKWEWPKRKLSLVEAWRDKFSKEDPFLIWKKESTLSQASLESLKGVPLIKTLVALCPLLGLLGTVTGMISVFDVMALSGTGNARMMASGISMATIPTMAGMVGALSGLYFGSKLESIAFEKMEELAENLDFIGGDHATKIGEK